MQFSESYDRIYLPLNVSVVAVCLDTGSPLTQTIDGVNFYPDRKVVQSRIYPQILATADDGSWDNTRSNVNLTNMVWKASTGSGWKDISTLSEWNGLYEIDNTATSNRGTLYVKRNLGANDKQQLIFEADLLDYRTKKLHHIITEPVTLFTVNKGEDTYGIGIGVESNITYNPVLDKLALYEYLVANDLKGSSDSERNSCFDGNEYLRTIPIDIYKSKNKVTSGYSLQVFRVNESGAATQIVPSSNAKPNELVSLSLTAMVLDLRQVMKNDYIIKCVVGGKVVCQFQFNVSRSYPSFELEFLNKNGIKHGQINRGNKLLVHYNNVLVVHPHRILRIKWKTVAHNEGGENITKEWQCGDSCQYSVKETELGESELCRLEDRVDYSQKPNLSYAIDKNGAYLTDKNGVPYLV